MSFVYFIILISVLIFVHEFGHFIVAKACGVKVVRFAIGMGPAIVTYQGEETEYAICAAPIGGYVQMLGGTLESTEDIPEEDRDRALMVQPIWRRSLIALAGPVFNLVLPVVIYFFVAMGQTTLPPAHVGEVFPDTPAAAAGLKAGDRLVSIDSQPVKYWYQITNHISSAYGRKVTIQYERDGKVHTTTVTPQTVTTTDVLGLNTRTYGMLGIELGTYGPTLAIRDANGPAARAGLRDFDQVLAINGKPIKRYDELAARVRNSGGKPLNLVLFRRLPIDVPYGDFYAQHVVQATVTPVEVNGHYSIGIDRAEMYLTKAKHGSPAAAAGLDPGDKIVAMNAKPYNNWTLMVEDMQDAINKQIVKQLKANKKPANLHPAFPITYIRAGKKYTTVLHPKIRGFKGVSGQTRYRVVLGWGHFGDTTLPKNIPISFFPRLGHAAAVSFGETTGFVKVMVLGFVRMAQGRVSLKSVGGPILIGQLAAKAGKAGLEPFLEMMALISINLAIINLLPVPVLDGGHLLLFALEAIKRGPLSFRTRQIATYVGLTFVVLLMVLAFKNDISRNWDSLVRYINNV